MVDTPGLGRRVKWWVNSPVAISPLVRNLWSNEADMAYVPSGMSIGEKLRNSPKRNVEMTM